MLYDVAIIGSGPAGLTAGIYSSRGKMKTIIFEGDQPGGQLTTTTGVENWPGDVSVMGPDLMERMREHAQKYGAELVHKTIIKTDFSKTPFRLETQGGEVIEAKSVIVATGAKSKRLGCPGEAEYFSKGVSTCATCDAPFYQDREVVIIGGGDTAMTEAEHLSKFAKKITVIQITDSLTGKDPIKFRVQEDPKVDFMFNSTVKEIKGDGNQVTSVVVENVETKEVTELPTQGVFLAIGYQPNTNFLKDQIELDNYGYVVLRDHTKTSIDGVFCAGDAADFKYRQAITSAGEGCKAALDAQAYLVQQEMKES